MSRVQAVWRDGFMDERKARLVLKKAAVYEVLYLNRVYHEVWLEVGGSACVVPFHEVTLLSLPKYMVYRAGESARQQAAAPKPVVVAV